MDKHSMLSYVTNAIVAFVGFMNLEFLVMGVGVCFAAATYFTSRFYQRRRDAREQEKASREKEMHELKMKAAGDGYTKGVI